MVLRDISEIEWFSPRQVETMPSGCFKRIFPSIKVLEREDFTEDLLRIYLEKPHGFDFEGGQYCTIGMGAYIKYEQNGVLKERYEIIWRPYSIVSAPHEERIELFIELVPKRYRRPDSLTPQIWDLYSGDKIFILPSAKGVFKVQDGHENHLMIATVTGIAPFMSMARTKAQKKEGATAKEKFHIMYGGSYQYDFGSYLFELRDQHHVRGTVYNFVATVSRPDEEPNIGWMGAKGRVNNIVEEYIDLWGLKPENTKVYVCGHEGMIDDLANDKPTEEKPLGKLIKRGFSVEKEMYF